MIPLSGFLSRALGTRILFAASAAGFTAASLMCGLSSSINEMIFWRAVQGFIGGGMIPTVFATAFTIFPRSKLGIISPLIGLVATLAPTIGPTVGGYLTDAFSWHWLFFIDIVPGIGVTVAALTLIDFDKPDYRLFDHFDWIGLLAMAGFLGALEYVLEEGPRNDWFADGSIVLLAWCRLFRDPVLLARVHRAGADRRSQGVRGSQFRARQPVLVRARDRALWAHLHLPALSRADPRLRRADDRRDPVRLGPCDVPDRAGRGPPHRQARSARDAHPSASCSSPPARGG